MDTKPKETREMNPKTCSEAAERESLSIPGKYAMSVWKLECSLEAEIQLAHQNSMELLVGPQ